MKRPSYREAVEWLALNDDTTWVEFSPESGDGSISVSGALACDLFGVEDSRLRKDLQAKLAILRVRHIIVPPTDGKLTWHGQYHFGGNWHIVSNKAGHPLAYASPEAAIKGASHTWRQRCAALAE